MQANFCTIFRSEICVFAGEWFLSNLSLSRRENWARLNGERVRIMVLKMAENVWIEGLGFVDTFSKTDE